MAADVGSKAPDFALVNGERETVKLKDAIGSENVVLAFFPGAFSGTCTKEMCAFRDAMSQLKGLNAKVFGISTDTFFTLKAWGDQQKLGFPLLSDYNKEAIQAYGVVNPDMIGLKNIAKRAVFVLDKGGTIRYREVLEDARNEPDYDKLKQALAQVARLQIRSWKLVAEKKWPALSTAPSVRSTPSRSSRSMAWTAATKWRFSSAG